MFGGTTLETIILDLALAIISAIFVVPIVLKINDYLTFNEYLRLLTKEIQTNLENIDQLPMWLARIRNRERAWLPGINSNQPQPGYVLKYLSMNIYNNFLNQRYWIYLNRRTADKLSELYEFIRRYCDLIQDLQTMDRGHPIMRDPKEHVIDENLYSDERFLNPSLLITAAMIKVHANELNLNDINSFKDPQWWYPNWLKKTFFVYSNQIPLMAAKLSIWDIIRIVVAIALLGYGVYTLNVAQKIQDSNLALTILALVFAVVGLAFSIISSIITDMEIRKLQK